MKLTYFLLRPNVVVFEDALDPAKLSGTEAFQLLPFSGEPPFDGAVYFQPNRQTEPKWLSFIADHVQLPEAPVLNQTSSALIILRTQARLFSISLGFGFHALDDSKIEPGFGLIASLQGIDPEKIRSIDANNIDYLTKQRRVLTSLSTALNEFEVGIQGELIRKVSGELSDPTIGKKLSGSDSASLNADVVFSQLPLKCEALLSLYHSNVSSPLVELARRIEPVRDVVLIAQLDGFLVDAVIARNASLLSIASTSIEWERLDKIKVFHRRTNVEHDELNLGVVFDFLEANMPESDLDTLKKVKAIGLDEEGKAVSAATPIYQLLSYEVEHDQRRFVFSMGTWYEVAATFYAEIDAEIRAIAQNDLLPPIEEGEWENGYNARVASAEGHVLLDRVNFQAPHGSAVEVCDLLTSSGQFICVKRETESSTLSHLFSQGSVSATCLNDMAEYREYIVGHVPNEWNLPLSRDSLQKENLTFIFAISTARPGALADILPFFSKVNLRNHARDIRRMNFKVALCKIDIQPANGAGA